MSFVRVTTERLLVLLFWLTRCAFLAQGLAMGTALLGASMASRQAAPPWLEIALRSSLLVGVTLFVAGVLLVVVARRPLPARVDGEAQPDWPWPGLLGACLAALPVLAYEDASGLFLLWRELVTLLDGSATTRTAESFCSRSWSPCSFRSWKPPRRSS